MVTLRTLTRPGVLVGLFILLLAGTVLGFWSTDYGVKADVVEKRCPGATLLGSNVVPSIVVRTRMAGYERAFDVRPDQCLGIPENAFVVFHVRTQRVLLYESEGGSCIYDSIDAECR